MSKASEMNALEAFGMYLSLTGKEKEMSEAESRQELDLSSIPYEFWGDIKWNEIMFYPAHYRQRNTAKHAEKALRDHLRKPSATHGQFVVAWLNGKPECMIDGHTRRYLIDNGLLAMPRQLSTIVFMCSSREEVDRLYDHYDNKSAVETSEDRVYGAFCGCGYLPKSGLMKSKGVGSALMYASKLWSKEFSDVARIGACIEVVKVVDSWNFNSGDRLRRNAMMSLLFALVMDHMGDSRKMDVVKRFFLAIQDDMGEKDGKARDGVQSLLEYASKHTRSDQEAREEFMAIGLTCFNNYEAGKMMSKTYPSTAALAAMLVRNNEKVMFGRFGDVPKRMLRGKITAEQRRALDVASAKEAAHRGRGQQEGHGGTVTDDAQASITNARRRAASGW